METGLSIHLLCLGVHMQYSMGFPSHRARKRSKVRRVWPKFALSHLWHFCYWWNGPRPTLHLMDWQLFAHAYRVANVDADKCQQHVANFFSCHWLAYRHASLALDQITCFSMASRRTSVALGTLANKRDYIEQGFVFPLQQWHLRIWLWLGNFSRQIKFSQGRKRRSRSHGTA